LKKNVAVADNKAKSWMGKRKIGGKNILPDEALVDKIIALDDQRKKLQLTLTITQAKINIASKEIGQLMAKR